MVKKRNPKAAATGRGAAKSGKAAAAARASSSADPQVARIQRVIDVMVAAGAVEVELEDPGGKLRIRLKEDPPRVAYAPPAVPAATIAPPAEQASAAAGSVAKAEPAPPAGEMFKSPMVGTFYRAAAPDADPFVKVGDQVTPDTVLCIIEAMKVMNEIKAEVEGQIVDILAQNGEAVDYGQPLFVIRT